MPDRTPALVPAIGYIRVSWAREEMIAPETQRAAITACAARKGYAIIGWAEDLDMTGRNFKRKIMNVIARVKAGEAEAIIVWKFSRFGRERVGVQVYLAELEEAGGRLVSATEDVDTTTATGKFQRGVLLEVSAFESDRAAETWAETYGWRVREGLPPFGRPRFGYRLEGRVRDEDDPHRTRHVRGEEERYVPALAAGSEALASAYRAYIAGSGFHAIAGQLNAAGWVTAYEGRWRAQAVMDVLDSGFGAGLLRLHDPACRCKRKSACPRRAWLKGAHEPVIGADEWEAYRRRREEVAALPPRSREARYPVTGLVRCGHCRAAMVPSGYGSGGAALFTCSRRRQYGDCEGKPSLSVSRITGAVREIVTEWAQDIDAAAVDAVRAAGQRDAAAEIARLEDVLDRCDRRLVKLAIDRSADVDGLLGDDAWKQAAVIRRAERDQAAADLAEARRALARGPSSDVVPALKGLAADWDLLAPADLNRVLRGMVRRIVVYREGEKTRDRAGWWKLMPARFEVLPLWEPDPWEGAMPRPGKPTRI
jgi:DNA invertase Pin-like site-specific DNA recombinase